MGASSTDQKVNMLISLYPGYGLGDAVQMSAVLRHIKKYRPDWQVHWQAEPGRDSVGRGIAHRCFQYGQQPDVRYDAEAQIVLYDTVANWPDRPNTRVVSCLREKFGIEWDRELARYSVEHQPCALVPKRSVAVHYRGDSAQHRKNLTELQARSICTWIQALGWAPLILDWRPDPLSITWGGVRKIAPELNGGCAADVCSAIAACDAFVGIDSGPSKCASATDTPALVIWTGHHPAPFHDPAPNTTHLVPEGYRGLEPVLSEAALKFFEANYSVRRYKDDPVEEACRWLSETLDGW